MQTELYWIEGPWTGRLAIMPRPRGGDWLEDEIASWRRRGIDRVVSTLTGEEIAELDLAGEKEVCTAKGIAFTAFPFQDRGIPPSRKAALGLVRPLEQELASGKKIAIHCRQGVGRSALLAACILAASGIDSASAWERIGRRAAARFQTRVNKGDGFHGSHKICWRLFREEMQLRISANSVLNGSLCETGAGRGPLRRACNVRRWPIDLSGGHDARTLPAGGDSGRYSL